MNIRVDLNTPIKDGMDVKFRSPVDCSQITGLIVYYNGEFREFAFADAHGNNVGDIDHLFAENVVVKVILDVTHAMAFVQNADTNAYLENRINGVDITLHQDLTPEKKAQVLSNIGINGEGGGSVEGAVLYTEQELTLEQQAQARENIRAVWQGDYGIIIQGQDSIAEIEVLDKPDDTGYKHTDLFFLGHEDGTVKLSHITDGTKDWDAATVGQVNKAVYEAIRTIEPGGGLPVVSASDAGKVLRVSSNGIWEAQSLINAEEVAF